VLTDARAAAAARALRGLHQAGRKLRGGQALRSSQWIVISGLVIGGGGCDCCGRRACASSRAVRVGEGSPQRRLHSPSIALPRSWLTSWDCGWRWARFSWRVPADASSRARIEADSEPFKGMLLWRVFLVAVGSRASYGAAESEPRPAVAAEGRIPRHKESFPRNKRPCGSSPQARRLGTAGRGFRRFLCRAGGECAFGSVSARFAAAEESILGRDAMRILIISP